MVSIITKNIKGNEYLYLVTSIREKDKVIQKTVKYIGKKRPISKHEFKCMGYSYSNEDWVLKEFNDELSYQDHIKLKAASKNYTNHLSKLDIILKGKERERFLASFISNSNAIEGSTLTEKETFNYLFEDLTPKGKAKKELFMANNLLKAWKYVEKNYLRFPSEKDLKELHKLVNGDIETEETLGKYKKVQNYIGSSYTSSYLFVNEKINQLFEWIRKSFQRVNDFEVAFQSHAQFEIIHPFVDGNGRVGRLLLNWLLMYKKLQPLAIRVNRRLDYIQALENVQKGKVEAICRFCLKEYLEQYSFM